MSEMIKQEKEVVVTPPTKNGQASVSSRPSCTPARACKANVNYKQIESAVPNKRHSKQIEKEKQPKPKNSKKDHREKDLKENQDPETCADTGSKEHYFWPPDLHQQFMR